MKTRRFFCEQKSEDGEEVTISGDEHFHLKSVLRFKEGEEIELFDGLGRLFFGVVKNISSSCSRVGIIKEKSEKKPLDKIILAVSVLKKKAMLSLIENLSEIGVDEIRPIIFSRTDVNYDKKNKKKWDKLSLMSLKVNGKLWPTRIAPPQSFNDFIEYSRDKKNKIILDLEGEKNNIISKEFPSLAVIGPPGDFTSEERKILVENGFNPIRINDCILRSEVAAMSISAILKTYL